MAPETLDRGTYELLRERVRGHGRELADRVEKVNTARKETFGGVEPELIATERVSTEHSCVPRDIAAVGDTLLFGFNVQFGLKATRSPTDALAAYTFSENRFHPRPLDLLADAAFDKDFQDVYRFYKDASFEKFVSRGPLLYMQLRTGPGEGDVKTFKWAVTSDGLRYVDNRSEHEVRLPPQYDFEWRRPRREDHVQGTHPHVNIADKVFVETVGGDLTIKVENNTESGEGIYAEPVENADQTLDDADIRYALLDSLVLLRITPYQESAARYIVYCEKTRQAVRLDRIGDCCRLLPADQGLIHPAGYSLHTGDGKSFDGVPAGAKFEQRIDAPNGEDFLYVFYHRAEGLYVLLRYNLIAQTADAPLLCHGFTLFPEGELVCFRAQPDPQRHHATQIWRTPFSAESLLPEADASSELFKIGNREIVAGLSACREILTLLDKEDSYGDLYAEIAKRAGDLLDSYHWIRSEATLRLDEPLLQIRSAATAAIDEYEKVARARESGRKQTADLTKRVKEAVAAASRQRFEAIAEFTRTLAAFRTLRGETIGLREVRYTDAGALAKLEETLKVESERVAGRCVGFLDRPEALTPFRAALETQRNGLDEVKTARDAKTANEQVAEVANDLEMLIETISNLPIEDATQRTRVVDSISTVFATVNALRAEIRNRRNELARTEGAAEFGAQLKLLGQAVANAIARCDSPEECDRQLTRLLLQIEELEGRFAEFDEFAVTLAEKREEVTSAFETRKSSLLEARAKRADALAAAADRLLGGIASRSKTFDAVESIHGYFAGDLTVAKIRDLATQLTSLGDAVRADGLLTRLKSLRDDAVRQLKDRQDLFAEGAGIINLGGYRFSVNTQPVSLTTVVRDEQLNLHLTGTRFYEPLGDPELSDSRDCWNLQYVSESPTVYRGEYLAYSLFAEERAHHRLDHLAAFDDAALLAWVAERMAPRYSEGYLKGVHDRDANAILRATVTIDRSLGPLRTPPASRALARFFWNRGCAERAKERLMRRLSAVRDLAAVWPGRLDTSTFRDELRQSLAAFVDELGRFTLQDAETAAAFLVDQLVAGDVLAVSRRAVDLTAAFRNDLARRDAEVRFHGALDLFGSDVRAQFELACHWLAAFTGEPVDDPATLHEAAALLLTCDPAKLSDSTAGVIDATTTSELTGLLGEHPVIKSGVYQFDYHRFIDKVGRHDLETVPKFRRFVELKHAAVEQAHDELRLDEFKPRVMASFIRNRLIDATYLPLIGANLAKQIGVAGEETRVDRQGMLLLISPPGYGKTTLMEYVADRLGLIFLKINGPAIGHAVTSLDPASAPNLAAREELKKLGFGLEAGDNVMIYVDDIQHCDPEFLQKFISLCDAQRKIEGVWRGEAKTYDLRGRKVAVVMSGNPYTESGEKFQIPDMLANRADVYNLGDITGRHRDAFELSFLENALTSNASLARLADRPADAAGVAALAADADPSSVALEGTYDAGELQSIVSVMRKLLRVRDVILKVNAEYIRSAAQADEFRVAPPFKLQGSYRNMNRIAEKVLPAMNDAELDDVIWSSYRNDAQTLTTGAESNLLRFREIVGWSSADEAKRWNEIKASFCRNQKLRGVDQSDRFGQAIAQLSLFADGLTDLRETLSGGIDRLADGRPPSPSIDNAAVVAPLNEIHRVLAALGASVQENLARLADRQTDAGEPRHVTLDPNLLRSIIESLQPIAANNRNGDEAPAPTAMPDTVTIVNKIPSTLLNVLREQFRLMETWLKPVLSASERQSKDYEELTRQIRTCLSNYERLVGRIEASRQDGRS
ncbi:MAG: DNA repair ATPase [Planctomycetaceae bacterium]